MKTLVKVLFGILLIGSTVATVGCRESETENAIEDAGEKTEETVEDAGDAVEDAAE